MFVVLYSVLEASTDVMNTGFLIVTIYVESKKLLHLCLLFYVYYGDIPSDWSLNLSKVQVLVLCVCWKSHVVMVVCPHLLGYGKELAH